MQFAWIVYRTKSMFLSKWSKWILRWRQLSVSSLLRVCYYQFRLTFVERIKRMLEFVVDMEHVRHQITATAQLVTQEMNVNFQYALGTFISLYLTRFRLSANNSLVCSGNGSCVSPNNCSCLTGFTAGQCLLPICYGYVLFGKYFNNIVSIVLIHLFVILMGHALVLTSVCVQRLGFTEQHVKITRAMDFTINTLRYALHMVLVSLQKHVIVREGTMEQIVNTQSVSERALLILLYVPQEGHVFLQIRVLVEQDITLRIVH
jgi:hypothetical protein